MKAPVQKIPFTSALVPKRSVRTSSGVPACVNNRHGWVGVWIHGWCSSLTRRSSPSLGRNK